jgi:uncharacterized protein YdhG (YjbR/CyaY superfamily)
MTQPVRTREEFEMAEKTKSTAKAATGTSSARNSAKAFTAEERDAMKQRARELKAEERASKNRAEGERAALEAIAAMEGPDRAMAKRLHELVTSVSSDLWPKTWYGMPAYAKDGKVVCFFQDAAKFKSRYATFGFSDEARLDRGPMWPTSFALTELTPAAEKEIRSLVKKAVS